MVSPAAAHVPRNRQGTSLLLQEVQRLPLCDLPLTTTCQKGADEGVLQRQKEEEMSWTTDQVTQNGNTTGNWTITGSALSTHDAVVVGPTSGSSGLRINSITVKRSPTSYSVSLSVIGSAAMAFRFYAEQMD